MHFLLAITQLAYYSMVLYQVQKKQITNQSLIYARLGKQSPHALWWWYYYLDKEVSPGFVYAYLLK